MGRAGQTEWWDREFTESGELIRADVRMAAREIWDRARRKVEAVLGDEGEAAELMEAAVGKASENLNKKNISDASHNVNGLLIVILSREVNRVAAKRRRVQSSGTSLDLDKELQPRFDGDLDRKIDQIKILQLLNAKARLIWNLRNQGYDWEEVATFTGISSGAARTLFWRDLRKAMHVLQDVHEDAAGPTRHSPLGGN